MTFKNPVPFDTKDIDQSWSIRFRGNNRVPNTQQTEL